MKHAILITAYENWDYLLQFVNKFNRCFNIYIHIDAKSDFPLFYKQRLEEIENVMYINQVYKINWGSMAHVDAILHLCKKAYQNPQNQMFHLLSGCDFLTQSAECVRNLNSQYSYMEWFSLPDNRWENGGLDRIRLYHHLDRLNLKNFYDYEVYSRYIKWQRSKKIRKSLPDITFYGGSTWWSLNRESISYILKHKNYKGIYDTVRTSFVPEEIYFHTILLNSPLAKGFINNNLRFIDWNYKNGNNPSVLDEFDYEKIRGQINLFARKSVPHISTTLLQMLEKDDDSRIFLSDILLKGASVCDLFFQKYLVERKEISDFSLNTGVLGGIILAFFYERYRRKQNLDKCLALLNRAIKEINLRKDLELYADLGTAIRFLIECGFLDEDNLIVLREYDTLLLAVISRVELLDLSEEVWRYLLFIIDRFDENTKESILAHSSQRSVEVESLIRLFFTNEKMLYRAKLSLGLRGYAGCVIAHIIESEKVYYSFRKIL